MRTRIFLLLVCVTILLNLVECRSITREDSFKSKMKVILEEDEWRNNSLAKQNLTMPLTNTSRSGSSSTCIGEFELCPNTNECVLISTWCGQCSSGQYLCPDGVTCVNDAASYEKCPNLAGTHLDWTISIDERIAYLIAHATWGKIQQLQNQAPAIPELGIPAYNWLNDDVHSVMQTHATVFPNGCGLGASWDKSTLFDVGYLIGNEARATHNGRVHSGDRGQNDENGVGITTYAPNINLVRDPRWGRNQEVYSEDPYLTSRLAVAYVKGQQGANE